LRLEDLKAVGGIVSTIASDLSPASLIEGPELRLYECARTTTTPGIGGKKQGIGDKKQVSACDTSLT